MKEPECVELETCTLVAPCGPVRPSDALGGRLLGALKSYARFTATVPVRCIDWLQSFTLIAFCTLLFLLATYTMEALSFFDVSTVCLSAAGVLTDHQVYRIFTYGAFHSNFLHVLINAVFLSSVGKTVEGKLGSFYFLNVVLVFGTLCAVIQITLDCILSLIYPPITEHCLSGFSGILFGVLVLALGVSKSKRYAVYGCCYIPKALYPWLLIVGCQILTYNQFSVTSNLAGIITGYAYMNDFLNFLKLTPYMILNLERSEFFHWFADLPGFVYYPKGMLIPFANPVTQRRRVAAENGKGEGGSRQKGKSKKKKEKGSSESQSNGKLQSVEAYSQKGTKVNQQAVHHSNGPTHDVQKNAQSKPEQNHST